MKFSKFLAIWFALSLTVACSDNEVKSADPVEQANSEDEKSSGDQTGNSSIVNLTNAGLDRKTSISETKDGLRLKAVIDEEEITLATLEVLIDGEVDQQATGQIVFRLARIENIDKEKLIFINPRARVCGEDEDPDDSEDGCDFADDCYGDDCFIAKPLDQGVATLFGRDNHYPAGEAIAVDGVEIYAEYKDQQPERKTKGRFSFEATE